MLQRITQSRTSLTLRTGDLSALLMSSPLAECLPAHTTGRTSVFAAAVPSPNIVATATPRAHWTHCASLLSRVPLASSSGLTSKEGHRQRPRSRHQIPRLTSLTPARSRTSPTRRSWILEAPSQVRQLRRTQWLRPKSAGGCDGLKSWPRFESLSLFQQVICAPCPSLAPALIGP